MHDEHVVTVQARSSCYISLQGVHSLLVSFCRELNLVLSDPSFQIRFLSIGDDLKRKKKKRPLFFRCDVQSLGQPLESQFIMRMSQCWL